MNFIKKVLLLIGFCNLFSISLQAQLSPYFQTTFYFEDAIGNKDTLFYGYDEAAGEGVDTTFGEVDISAIPMDSVFEVRFISQSDFNNSPNSENPHFKKFIGRAANFFEPVGCYDFTESGMIIVNIKHLPLTIHWNSETFDSSYCNIGSYFTSQSVVATIYNWFEMPEFLDEFVCMSEENSFSFSFEVADPHFDEWTWRSQEIVEGIGLDTVYGIAFGNAPQGPNAANPCAEVFVSTNELSTLTNDFQVYPNPSSGFVQFSNTASYQLYDLQGRLLRQEEVVNKALLEDYSAGVYFLRIDLDGAVGYRKLILE